LSQKRVVPTCSTLLVYLSIHPSHFLQSMFWPNRTIHLSTNGESEQENRVFCELTRDPARCPLQLRVKFASSSLPQWYNAAAILVPLQTHGYRQTASRRSNHLPGTFYSLSIKYPPEATYGCRYIAFASYAVRRQPFHKTAV